MKKLRVALVLLFTLCCTLFLFACGEKEDDAILQSIDVTGMKTSFTEADKEFKLGDDFTVTATFKTTDPEKATRVLDADEYTVSKDAVDAAFKAIADKNYGSARGTYTITVSATKTYEGMGDVTRSFTYDVTIDHAWNADKTECSVCGATQVTYKFNDELNFQAWGDGLKSDLNDGKHSTHVTKNAGEIHVSYGSVGMGQQIAIRGVGQQNAGTTSTTYFFPIIGVRNGTKGTASRNDAWNIYDGPKGAYKWPEHTAGLDSKTAEFPGKDAAEWDIYQTGTICSTADWNDECEFEIVWNYREDGVMVYTINNITAGKAVTRYMAIPNAVYECVLYGEFFTYQVKEVTYTSNLTLEDFKMNTPPTKLIYAENTMLDIGEDKNLNGVVATAYYNQETSNVSTQVMTYDILADVQQGDKVVTVDLRENELTAEMTNFRIKFGTFEVPLNLTILPSAIDDVTTNYNFDVNGVQFMNDMGSYVYDVVKVGNETVVGLTASGNPNKLSAAQKEALGTEKEYYVAFRLVGADKLSKYVACSDAAAKIWLTDNGICVVIPVSEADLKDNKTVSVYTEGQKEVGASLLPTAQAGVATRVNNTATTITLENGALKIVAPAEAVGGWTFNDQMLSGVTLKPGQKIHAEMVVDGQAILVAYTEKNPAANNFGKPNGYVFDSSNNKITGEFKGDYTFEELLAMLKGRSYTGSETEIEINMLSYYIAQGTTITVKELSIQDGNMLPGTVASVATRAGNTANTITLENGALKIVSPAETAGGWTFNDQMLPGIKVKPGEAIYVDMNVVGQAILVAYTEKNPAENSFGKPNGYLFNSSANKISGAFKGYYTFEELLAMLKGRSYTGSETEIELNMISYYIEQNTTVTINDLHVEKVSSLLPAKTADVVNRAGFPNSTATVANGALTLVAPASTNDAWSWNNQMLSGVTLKPGQALYADINVTGELILVGYTEKDPSANNWGKPNGYLFNSGATHITGVFKGFYTFDELLAMLNSRGYKGSQTEIELTMLGYDLADGSTATINALCVVDQKAYNKTEVTLGLSGMKVPEVSAIVTSNDTTIDKGGKVVVTYYGIKNETDAAKYKYSYANISRTYDQLTKGTTGGGNLVFSGEIKDGALVVTYELPTLNVTSSALNLSQVASVMLQDNTVLAKADIRYNLDFSEEFYEKGTSEGFYLTPVMGVLMKVVGSKLYFLTAEVGTNLQGGTIELSLNINNETSTNAVGRAYDLSFTANNTGIEMLSANAVSNATTVATSVVGTVGDNTDCDYAAGYVLAVDLKAGYGVRNSADEVFYMEFAGVQDAYYKVDAANKITSITVNADDEGGVLGTCIYSGSVYSIDKTLKFAFANTTVEADGVHNYAYDAEKKAYVCDKCGSVHYVDEEGKDTIEQGAKIGKIENATATGISVSFTLKNNMADWQSATINPLKADKSVSGLLITIPNLDPYGNSAGFKADTNRYPEAEDLYNGAAFNAFQTKDTPCLVTIVISPESGITYYKDGLKVISYATTRKFGDGTTTVGAFVEKVLELIEANGFELAAGKETYDENGKLTATAKENMGEVSNITVYTAALSEKFIETETKNALGVTVNGKAYTLNNYVWVRDFENLDPSGDWWNGNTSTFNVPAGDFYIHYEFQNTRDKLWYADSIIELNIGGAYLDQAFMKGTTDSWGEAFKPANHKSVWTKNGEKLEGVVAVDYLVPGATEEFEGDYSVDIIREGTTLTIVSTIVKVDGTTYQCVDTYTEVSTAAVVAGIVGNPFWLDNFIAYWGVATPVAAK